MQQGKGADKVAAVAEDIEPGHSRFVKAQPVVQLHPAGNTLVAGQYIIRYTAVLSNRFDTTAFKKVMPEIYKAYTKQVSSRRFTISV